MATVAPRCSTVSEARREPLTATASRVTDWLLIEHDGPWGREAFADARLLGETGSALVRRTRANGVRPILIRRIGRAASRGVTIFAVHSGPDAPWIERLRLERIEETLDLDIATLGLGASLGGEPVSDPLFLVCTHGRHDPCCAERGRPLAAAVAASFPDPTWECSHIGGDRFAGNLVAFPLGLYFGRAGAEEGPRIAQAYLEGRIELDHYRGRSCHVTAAQAAERFARVTYRLDGVDDLRVGRVRKDDTGATVILHTATGMLRVEIAIEAGPRQKLTCHSEAEQSPPVYRLKEMTPLSGEDPDP
jgi:hypothetical protein